MPKFAPRPRIQAWRFAYRKFHWYLIRSFGRPDLVVRKDSMEPTVVRLMLMMEHNLPKGWNR